MKDNSFLESVLSVLRGKSTIMILSFAFTPAAVRILTQSEYGIYASVMATFSVVTIVSSFGLFHSIRKYIAEYRDNLRDFRYTLVASIGLSTLYGTIVTVLFLLYIHYFSHNGVIKPYLYIISAGILGKNLFTAGRGIFYGLQDESTSENIRIVNKVVFVILGLTLAATGLKVFGILTSLVIGIYLSCLLYIYAIFVTEEVQIDPGKITNDLESNLDEIILKSKMIASYGGIQAIGAIAASLHYRVDILLVDHFLDSTSTALYQAALTPAELIWFIPAVFQATLLQDASYNWSNNNKHIINENATLALKYSFLGLTLFGVGLFGLAPEFVETYFGQSYINSVTSLRILIVGSFLFGLSRVFSPILQATGWIKYIEFFTVISLAINILLNVVLIPQYGIVGAAAATSGTYGLMLVWSLIVWQYSEQSIQSSLNTKLLIAILIVFSLSFLLIVDLAPLGNAISLIVLPLIGLTTFLFLCNVTGIVDITKIVDYIRAYT